MWRCVPDDRLPKHSFSAPIPEQEREYVYKKAQRPPTHTTYHDHGLQPLHHVLIRLPLGVAVVVLVLVPQGKLLRVLLLNGFIRHGFTLTLQERGGGERGRGRGAEGESNTQDNTTETHHIKFIECLELLNGASEILRRLDCSLQLTGENL